MTVEPKERLYSVKEAAVRLKVTPGRVRQLVVEGRIRPVRLSYELIIPESEILRYDRERRPYRKTK